MSEELFEEYTSEPLPVVVVEGVDREAERIIKSYRVKAILEYKSVFREKLNEKNMLKRISKYSGLNPCILAIDTGFTSPLLELTGGRLLVVIRSHVFQGCSELEGYSRCDSVGYVRFTELESIAPPLSKVYERDFIYSVLRDKKAGRNCVDIVLIDGELFPRIPPGYIGRRVETSSVMKLYNKILLLTEKILELAVETDTALIGVIKRSYGRDIAIRISDRNATLNDKALATYILERGEWIDLGRYPEIMSDLERFINTYNSVLSNREKRGLWERYRWISSVLRSCSYASDIHVAVYKPYNPTYFQIASKIEYIPSNSYPQDKLLSYIASITGVNGVPHPIDLVDSMSMVRRELLYLIQQQLFQQLAKLTGDRELALSIAGLTNPEKMQRIGFR